MGLNRYFFLRVFVGLFFMLSGFEKLIEPMENFLYVVQSYDVFPPVLETAVAIILPWVEWFLGIFLALGLWIPQVARSLALLFVIFVGILAQAIFRKLPIGDCGCFGGLFLFPLKVTLLIDLVLLGITFLLKRNTGLTEVFSLDRFFRQKRP